MNFKQMALLFWKAQPDEEENHERKPQGTSAKCSLRGVRLFFEAWDLILPFSQRFVFQMLSESNRALTISLD